MMAPAGHVEGFWGERHTCCAGPRNTGEFASGSVAKVDHALLETNVVVTWASDAFAAELRSSRTRVAILTRGGCRSELDHPVFLHEQSDNVPSAQNQAGCNHLTSRPHLQPRSLVESRYAPPLRWAAWGQDPGFAGPIGGSPGAGSGLSGPDRGQSVGRIPLPGQPRGRIRAGFRSPTQNSCFSRWSPPKG